MTAIGSTPEARFVQASKVNRRLIEQITKLVGSSVPDATWDGVADYDTAYCDAMNGFVQHGTPESMLRFKDARDALLRSWERFPVPRGDPFDV